MDSIRIDGNVALRGSVKIQGSKNAALPILAATILTNDTSYIYNCPKIADVYSMINLLKSLGATVCWHKDYLSIDSSLVCEKEMPSNAIKGMRSSIFLLGALLGRCGRISMEYPGGCVIGKRPIDMHIKALEQMGVSFKQEKDILIAQATCLHGADIELRTPSVGATENIILAAVTAEGETVINNAAREPEVVALCDYLSMCGACIEGIGERKIRIVGKRLFNGIDYTIPPDRIVAGTYIFATIGTMGNVFLEGACAENMHSVLEVADRMGAYVETSDAGIYVFADDIPSAVNVLRTENYPGFPTDLQSIALAVLSIADGCSKIEESIFENRFRVVPDLKRMGADISVIDNKIAFVNGVPRLKGTKVTAYELRGGAALVLAGLFANGETTIDGTAFIERGYENICRDLRELGARIVGV